MTWKKVKMGDILTESKIESKISDPDKRITVRLNLKGVEKRPFEKGVEGATKYFVRKAGQFIYGKQNLFKGAFGIIPKELDEFESSSDIPTFDVRKDCLPEWLFYFLKQNNFYTSLESIATGTGSRRIQPSRLYEVEIPLPSITEQKKIIKSCDLAEYNFEKIDNELNQQQTYLQLLRQTILQEAVQGKLTKQDLKDEPATELLKRIKAEKQKLIKAGKVKKEKELPPITEDEIPFELPEGWVWCRWRDLLAFTQYPMKRGPFGSSLKKDMFVEKGIRVFEQYNPINDDPYWVRYYITEKKYAELKAFTAIAGDLLISCSGATLGRITELPEDAEFGIINQALLKLTLNSGVISNAYFIMLFRSSFIQSTILEEAGGSAIPNMVGVSVLKEILIPLPPLAEQKRIVAKVQQLQKQLNQLEAHVKQSRQYAQQLLQSVLKEAFEEKGKVYEMEEERVWMVAEE